MSMLRVMCELPRDAQLRVGRLMHDNAMPWGIALWDGVGPDERRRLASIDDCYRELVHHWPVCEQDLGAGACDCLATEYDTDGAFVCAAHLRGEP